MEETAADKQPYAIALADRRLVALAGLWENWRSPAGERIRSFAIVTARPNELCVEIHNRMRVVRGPETWPAWPGRSLPMRANSRPCSRPIRRQE